MSPKLAQKRYIGAIMGFGGGYIGTLIGVVMMLKTMDEPAQWLVALMTLVPGFFVAAMLWALWRYVKEADEAQRYYLSQCINIGIYTVLLISGVWGLVELMAEELPRLPIFWVFPIFFGAFGLASCFGPGRGMGLR